MQGNRPRSARVHPPAAQSPPLTPWARAGAQGVSVRACPALAALRRPGEDVHALLDAPPEELLLRWLAHHLAAAGPPWRAPPALCRRECRGRQQSGEERSEAPLRSGLSLVQGSAAVWRRIDGA